VYIFRKHPFFRPSYRLPAGEQVEQWTPLSADGTRSVAEKKAGENDPPLRLLTNHFFVSSLPSAAEAGLILPGLRRGWKSARENSSFAPVGLDHFPLVPTAYPVGFIISPLRG